MNKTTKMGNDSTLPSKNIPDLDPLFNITRDFIKKHQGKKGYIDTQDVNKDMIFCLFIAYTNGGATEEDRVHGVRVKDDDIQVLFDTDTSGFENIQYADDDFRKEDANWYSIRNSEVLYVHTLFSIAESIEEYV